MRRVAPWLVLVAACGGSPPPPPASASTDNGNAAPTQTLIVGRFDEPRRPPPTAAPITLRRPIARTDRAASTNAPELAAAEAAYTRLTLAPLGFPQPPAELGAAVQLVIGQIEAASTIARDVGTQCSPYESAPAPLGAIALTLHADALDLLASHVSGTTIPMPLELTRGLTDASPEVVAEVQQQYDERLTALFTQQAVPIYCMAVELYQRALLHDPGSARATAQLAAYGADFVASCTP